MEIIGYRNSSDIDVRFSNGTIAIGRTYANLKKKRYKDMLEMKCIQKIRYSSGQIIEYILQDSKGNTRRMKTEQLKLAIKQKEIDVINLKLTSNNRLIEKKSSAEGNEDKQASSVIITREIIRKINCNKRLSFKSNKDLSKIKKKALAIGLNVIKIDKNILAIESKDEITLISSTQIELDCKEVKRGTKTQGLFKRADFKSIDFHEVSTSKIQNMKGMFEYCRAEHLDLSTFDTSQVTNMEAMFFKCRAKHIDLSSFDTSKVKNMKAMFYSCGVEHLDLSSFNTSQVKDMSYMFDGCEAKFIDLSSFDTSQVTNMSYMFYECQAHSLELSKFNTSKVTDMSYMFYKCKAQSLGLSSFDTSQVTDMSYMFFGCQVHSLDLSNLNILQVEEIACMMLDLEATFVNLSNLKAKEEHIKRLCFNLERNGIKIIK